MSRKRQLQSEEIFPAKRPARNSSNNNNHKEIYSGILEHLSPTEQRKKVELAWKKAKRQNSEKEINFKSEIDQIKKETHPILMSHIDKLNKDKEKKHILLDEWKEKQIKQIEESLEASRRECDDDYEKNVKEVKDHLLNLVNQDKKNLKYSKKPNRKSQRVRSNILRNKNFSSDGSSFSSIIQQIKTLSTLSDKEIREEMIVMNKAIRRYCEEDEENEEKSS